VKFNSSFIYLCVCDEKSKLLHDKSNKTSFLSDLVTYTVYYFTDVRWLKSATITLLSDNGTVSVLCDANESSPPVKCSVIVNCTTLKSVTTEVFDTGSTTVRIIPGNDCYITVQVVSTDTKKPMEDYSVTKTLSIQKPLHKGNPSKFMIFMYRSSEESKCLCI